MCDEDFILIIDDNGTEKISYESQPNSREGKDRIIDKDGYTKASLYGKEDLTEPSEWADAEVVCQSVLHQNQRQWRALYVIEEEPELGLNQIQQQEVEQPQRGILHRTLRHDNLFTKISNF